MANLRHACLIKSHLMHADFILSRLDYSDLKLAHLQHSRLTDANLSGADLRRAVGLHFDSNRVRNIHIESNGRDPWSILRRQYTGPSFFIHGVLLVAFAIPYVGRALALTAASQAGRALQYLPQNVPLVVDRIPAWKVLVGLERGWWAFALGCILILYNALRGILTLQVGLLRDAEERSSITPRLYEYMGTQKLDNES